MSTSRNSGSGVGFGTLLFLVFLVLKLCGVIDWSWLWVTAPLWLPFPILGMICAIVVAIAIWKGKK